VELRDGGNAVYLLEADLATLVLSLAFGRREHLIHLVLQRVRNEWVRAKIFRQAGQVVNLEEDVQFLAKQVFFAFDLAELLV